LLELSPKTKFGDQILRKDARVDGSIFDLRTVNSARKRLQRIKVWREVRHVLSSERSRAGQAEMDGFDGLGLKTITGGWFPDFGHKNIGRL